MDVNCQSKSRQMNGKPSKIGLSVIGTFLLAFTYPTISVSFIDMTLILCILYIVCVIGILTIVQSVVLSLTEWMQTCNLIPLFVLTISIMLI